MPEKVGCVGIKKAFELKARNKTTNERIYTNVERNPAMMMIYQPITFDFDWTNRFRVRVQKQTMLTNEQNTKKRTNEQME